MTNSQVLPQDSHTTQNHAPTGIIWQNGFTINGLDSFDRSGWSVSDAGDVNGDGFDDIIIGAVYGDRDGKNTGESYVIFGKASGFSTQFNATDLDGTNGFILKGIDRRDTLASILGNFRGGMSVNSAGDVNGDGFDDLIIGVIGGDPNGENSGESYVVFGKSSGFSPQFNLADLDGTNGFILNGINSEDKSGTSVSGAGDINGDGYDDVIIGARRASPNGLDGAGQSYVVFGKKEGFSPQFNLADLDGTNGFIVNGVKPGTYSGYSVSSAGDINGDGFDDLLIGVQYGNPNNTYRAGETYVVFGKKEGFSAQFNPTDLDGTNGFIVNGIVNWDRLGWSVSGAGDVNGDGFNDIILGAPGSSTNDFGDGESYVIFGKAGGFSPRFNPADLDGTNGFIVNGIDRFDYSGTKLSGAGDVNGDGFDDIIISAGGAVTNAGTTLKRDVGEHYVVFGKAGGFSAQLNASDLDGTNGFLLKGIDASDYSNTVSRAGDINGDGFDDLLIGASGGDPNGKANAGETYVVFGRSNFVATVELSDLGVATIDENSPNGKIVALLSTTESDVEDTHTYMLVDDAGGRFALNGNNEVVVADGSLLDFETHTSHTIRVKTTDQGGLSFTQNLIININDVSEVNETTGIIWQSGFTINGINSRDFSGNSVSSADVNRDGFNDLIIGALGGDPNGVNSGESYVILGKAGAFESQFKLADLDGTNGFIINGINRSDLSGSPVSNAGDVNGDGFEDILIGAPGGDPNGIVDAGEAYLIFGKAGGFSAQLNLADLNGTNGFIINGIDTSDGLSAVRSAGDVNGDGFDDIIIGAPKADPNGNNSGESYVIFGKAGGFSAQLNLADLNGTNGFIINGIDSEDFFGGAVGSADVNGDGFSDLLIAAHGGDPNGKTNAGETYVIFGHGGSFDAQFNLANFNVTKGFVINGVDVDDFSGWSVNGAGDINGDGIEDIMISAQSADSNGRYSGGEIYVVFGRKGGFSSQFNLANLHGNNGFTIKGIHPLDFSGRERTRRSISNAGDVNGDGFNDILIGADQANSEGVFNTGASYVIFGKAGGFAAEFNLADLNGSNGFTISRSGGYSVSAAGDVNGDGFDDVIVGASEATSDNGTFAAGQSYVVFGRSNFTANIELSELHIAKVEENAANGTVVALLSTIDPPVGDSSTYTYTLLDDAGGRFSLQGNQVIVANGSLLDHDLNTSHTIQVKSTAQGGSSVIQDLTVGVVSTIDGGEISPLNHNPGAPINRPEINPNVPATVGNCTGTLVEVIIPKNLFQAEGNPEFTWEINIPATGAMIAPNPVGDRIHFVIDFDNLDIPPFNGVGISIVATRTDSHIPSEAFGIGVRITENCGCTVGRACDNYIANATVFFDVNHNGLLDNGEFSTTTDLNGFFLFSSLPDELDTNNNGQLDPSEGSLVAFGGVDTATGLALETPLRATPDARIVSLLTTLVAEFVDQGLTVAQANAKVTTALSLNATVNLNSFDPIEATQNNEANGVATFAEMVKIQNFITHASGLLAGVSGLSQGSLVDEVVAAIASNIQSNTTLDLTNVSQLETILNDSATNAGVDVSSVANQTAQVMAAANTRVVQLIATVPNTEVEEGLAKIQKIALGKTTNDLEAVGNGTKSITDVVNENTGTALETQIAATTVFSDDPTSLTLSNNSIAENQAIGSEIGTFSTVDPNVGETHTYTLLNDSPFTIDGDRLLTAEVFDYETQKTYDLFVQVSDGNGGILQQSLRIKVNNVSEMNGSTTQDTIIGTDETDIITGYQGRDILTGNGGNDQFVYTSFTDAGDRITDFTVGEDKIVLTQLLDSLGYSGFNPIAEGFVQFSAQGSSNSYLKIDADGFAGSSPSRILALLENVLPTDLNSASNFVF